MPWPITSYPHIISTLPGKMSFGQRFANAVMYSMVRPLVLLLETLYQQGDDFGAELAQFDYGAAMKNAVLYLENSDNVLDYPKAVYPNFVQAFGVGGSVDLLTSSADEIAHIVSSLIDDNDVHQRMKKAATLFHDRPETPAQRAATALEHGSIHGHGFHNIPNDHVPAVTGASDQPVAFTVTHSTTDIHGLGSHQTVKFDKVLYNVGREIVFVACAA
nr:hypothetical protein BaRGS_018607 [Batillaria attramentaria]